MDNTTKNPLSIFSGPTAAWFREAFGEATAVQRKAWPAIDSGRPVLISAPTGTGKTLSAFLLFIDRLQELAGKGELKEELHLIYVSPLKSLAGDIRANLRRPLDGITAREGGEGAGLIHVGIRTGDTSQQERRRMVKHPPHILITTPESLFLMLTSYTGQSILRTAKALIIDELHALIDTKRGAHLMLSAARLDWLCKRKVQRIGLSATIEPLQTAAAYLSPRNTVIAAPPMWKEVRIEVNGITPAVNRRKDPVWEELAEKVYNRCLQCRSVIAFTEARRYAEKLAYYVNQTGGEDFARVHHGSMSKEQRAEVEKALRDGKLRLLCATSSMELGIDVGDIEQVLQVGCPRTISGTMQRLGRAGHNPGRVSEMYMYPRTAPETLYCGMTALVAKQGGVEQARPPRLCLDVLAQHLVSMAATGESGKAQGTAYTIEDVMHILSGTYSFHEVTKEDVKSILGMLAGDYEHNRELPVRPRVLYDRLHDRVFADSYSRMLAVAAGGTIPDKGLYTAKTEDGVKLGELDEEFVYESHLGDRFLLGAFAWKIVGQDKDTVVVKQTSAQGARIPFWKGETKGRNLATSLTFGKIMRSLFEAAGLGALREELAQMGLDEAAQETTADFLKRQLKASGVLPDDRTIIMEHFTDSAGVHQVMIHALFGRRINTPLSLILQHTAQQARKSNIGCVDDEDGILLYPYGEDKIPENLFYAIKIETVRETLEAMLPATPVFNMTFRYNAARALLMGMRRNTRQPLWLQRLRSTEMLETLIQDKGHPIIRETRRECMEDLWDIEGLLSILHAVRCGQIAVREMYLDVPSPMSLPMQWQVEAAEMYEYTPTTTGIRQAVYDELRQIDQLKPSAEALLRVQERKKLPEDAMGLHSFLMIEGDVTVEELRELYLGREAAKTGLMVSGWLEELEGRGLAAYIEPGLWIAAEQREEYEAALCGADKETGMHLIRRMLYYRGPHTAERIQQRYLPDGVCLAPLLETLCTQELIVEDQGLYYHTKLYDRARKATIRSMRAAALTSPPENYAALIAGRALINASAAQQLKDTLELFCGQSLPAAYWETILLPRRVKGYHEGMLDRLLAEGEYFWKMDVSGGLCFCKYDAIDWDAPQKEEAAGPKAEEAVCQGQSSQLTEEERIVYEQLCRRGASFLNALTRLPVTGEVKNLLTGLAEKGLVCADSFIPVRQWLHKDKLQKSTARQRVNARIAALSAGRWDIVHPLKPLDAEELLDRLFDENRILCRETFKRSLSARDGLTGGVCIDWSQALKLLRIREFTGQVRRGYFVRGLSGAQFIRTQEYEGIVQALARPDERIVWLNAVDFAQPWGRLLEHKSGRAFLNVPGTAVALYGGIPAMVLERQGRVLRIFQEDAALVILRELVRAFLEKTIFPEKKRLVIREYPEEKAEALKLAGFHKEMMDYTLYR